MRQAGTSQLIVFVSILMTCFSGYAEKVQVIDAKPVEVVVYKDRAVVTRQFKKDLDKGDHVLVFDQLPARIDQNSIQVNGKGLAEIQDVKFVRKYVKRSTNQQVQDLIMSRQAIADQIENITDTITQARAEKEFVVKITKKLTQTKQKESTTILDPQKWMKMVSFYRKKLAELDKEIRKAERKKRDLDLERQQIAAKIQQLGASRQRLLNQVHIKVNLPATGSVTLDL